MKAEVRVALDLDKVPDSEWLLQVSRVLGTARCGQANACSFSAVVSRGDLHVTADLRLSNKQEIIAAVGNRFSPEPDDADVVLLAYEKWGTDCASRLSGEFVFALWDDRQRHLYCARDHFGIRPAFYWHSGTRFLLSSDPEAILTAPGVDRRLNRRRLAGLSTFAARSHYHQETYHEGIYSLPSACSLLVSPTGVTIKSYWQPGFRPDVLPKQHNDILPGLRHLLERAVETRLDAHQPAAALLSGGLDSSAIVSLAARALAKRNRELLGVSAVVPDDRNSQFPDERNYIEEFRCWPNIRMEYVSAPDRGPFDSIEDPALFRHFAWRNPLSFMHDALGDHLLSRGVETVMDGDGGEVGPTHWGSRYYIELGARLRWTTLRRELKSLEQVRGTRPLRSIAENISRMFVPGRHRSHTSILFNPDFLRPFPKIKFTPDRSINHRNFQLWLARTFMSHHAHRRSHTGGGNIRITYPLIDKDVVEYCIAAPGSLKVHNGYPRHLVRAALDGILPKRIQWRSTKLHFIPDYNLRFNNQFAKAKQFVSEIRRTDPIRSVIDVDSLLTTMRPVADLTRPDFQANTFVPSTIYAICFLRQFSEFRP